LIQGESEFLGAAQRLGAQTGRLGVVGRLGEGESVLGGVGAELRLSGLTNTSLGSLITRRADASSRGLTIRRA